MIPSLPLDLLHMIIEGVDDDQSLARLCLASKLLLSMTRPLLYRDIEIEVRERVEHDHFEGREPVPHSVHEILARSSRLVTTLTEQPALASHVRQFDFTSVRPWAEGNFERPWAKGNFERIDRPEAVFRQVMELVTSVEHVTLVDPAGLRMGEIDSYLNKLQQGTSPSLAIHLQLLGQSYYSFEPLEAEYSSMDTNLAFLPRISPFASAYTNMTSLSLYYNLEFGRFSLTPFTSLVYFEAIFSLNASDSVTPTTSNHQPHRDSDTLLNTLRQVSTLERIVLSGDFSKSLEEFLSPDRLPASVPTSLLSLSIDIGGIGLREVAKVVKTLASDSGIKMLEIVSVDGELSEIQEACEKRGIKLALI